MKVLTDLVARILFALPMLIVGLCHFMGAEDMAQMAPFSLNWLLFITLFLSPEYP